jgi:hypothetical protein
MDGMFDGIPLVVVEGLAEGSCKSVGFKLPNSLTVGMIEVDGLSDDPEGYEDGLYDGLVILLGLIVLVWLGKNEGISLGDEKLSRVEGEELGISKGLSLGDDEGLVDGADKGGLLGIVDG